MARGYFGIGIENSKKEVNIGTLWRSAYCFEASFIFTIGARYEHQSSDTTKAWRHLPLFTYRDEDDFWGHIPHDIEIVGIELTEDAKPLKEFAHPERALYILGPEDGNLSKRLQSLSSHIISIDSKRCLNVAVAGSIVMYDRSIK